MKGKKYIQPRKKATTFSHRARPRQRACNVNNTNPDAAKFKLCTQQSHHDVPPTLSMRSHAGKKPPYQRFSPVDVLFELLITHLQYVPDLLSYTRSWPGWHHVPTTHPDSDAPVYTCGAKRAFLGSSAIAWGPLNI